MHWLSAIFNLCDFTRFITDMTSESFGLCASLPCPRLLQSHAALTLEMHAAQTSASSTSKRASSSSCTSLTADAARLAGSPSSSRSSLPCPSTLQRGLARYTLDVRLDFPVGLCRKLELTFLGPRSFLGPQGTRRLHVRGRYHLLHRLRTHVSPHAPLLRFFDLTDLARSLASPGYIKSSDIQYLPITATFRPTLECVPVLSLSGKGQDLMRSSWSTAATGSFRSGTSPSSGCLSPFRSASSSRSCSTST